MLALFKLKNQKELCSYTLRKKCPYSELFWSVFSRIQTEYRRILRISPFQSKCGKIETKVTSNTDTFQGFKSWDYSSP